MGIHGRGEDFKNFRASPLAGVKHFNDIARPFEHVRWYADRRLGYHEIPHFDENRDE